MLGQVKNMIARGKTLVVQSALAMRWSSIFIILLIGLVWSVKFIVAAWGSNLRFKEILYQHFLATIGVPLAVLTSLALVLTLEQVVGKIEFEMLGVKFKGAAGPLIMWGFCFLSLIVGIKVLW